MIRVMLRPFFTPFRALWMHRRLLSQTTWHEMRGRYAGSLLGLAWLIVYPMAFLGAYALVNIYVYRVKFGSLDTNEYVILIFCGLIPFIGFADALSTGVPSVGASSGLIKNTLFPIEMIPVKAVLLGQFAQVVATAMLFVTLGILGKLTVYVLLVPLVWVLQVLMMIGLVWILSSFNVFFRDIQTLISPIILVLMLITPIGFPADMIPKQFEPYLAINPLYYVVVSYQDCLMMSMFPRMEVFVWLCVLTGVFFVGGYWIFMRLKGAFAANV